MQMICTVLLVENDEDDARLAQLAFERAKLHHRLVTVADAAEAMDYLTGKGAYGERDKHPVPHLILLDLAMPGVSGLEFLGQLRREASLQHIPVTILSGSNYSPDLEKAYALGAKSFLEKASDLSKFGAAIKRIVECLVGAAGAPSSQTFRPFV
jgi:CheY-like chemotaxis protein